jgi:hypothetical protein
VPAKDISATGFTVKFRAIKSPFENDTALPYYPVQNYYLMVVKESKQFTFSVSQAEYALMNQKRRLVPVTLAQPTTGNDQPPPSTTAAQPKTPLVPQTISVPVDINSFSDEKGSYTLQDSDGEPITTGTNYVVYVMAVYVDEYKRKINVFDDFLSAPSQSFVLVNALNAAQNLAVSGPADDNTLTLTFTTNDNPDYKIEYRCMFLLQNSILSLGLLTQSSIDSINADIESLEEIAEQYDPQIEQLQANLLQLQQQQVTGDTDVSGIDETTVRNDLAKAIADRQAATEQAADTNAAASKISFVFNIDIAEHIPAANYTVATLVPNQSANTATDWQVTIGTTTTDNFGNLLLPTLQYIPVVLTMSAEEEANLPRFTNALTDFENTGNFTYPAQPPVPTSSPAPASKTNINKQPKNK